MAESPGLEWVGRVIDGRYVVDSILGSGGMGVVLRARHKFTGAQVAVKMLRADLQIDAELEARFLAEARAPNAIGHAGIVQVLDAGRTPEGELYLAMELLAGQPMRLAVSRGLGAPAIRRISLELLDALAAAHARGFVHRDLKPENVFLAEPNATVKLLDFGIAKVLAGDLGAGPGTAAGVVLGTLAYMAPEQLADARGVDARADLWAMGVMIYEMLAGRRPYHATTVEQMFVMLARDEPDSIRAYVPSVAPAIEAFFLRALARDPRARFGSAIEMAAALAQLPLVAPAPPPAFASPSGGVMTLATGAGAPPVTAAASSAIRVAPMAAPRANRSRAAGFALAGVAAIAISAAIVVAARGAPTYRGRTDLVATHDDDHKPAAATPLPTPPIDAPPPTFDPPPPPPRPAVAPPHTPHAPRAPIDAASAPPPPPPSIDAATLPPPPLPPPPVAPTCEAACLSLDSCHLRAGNCLDDCAKTQLHNCMAFVTGDCDHFAACYLAPICGGAVGRGTATCAATLACQEQGCRPGDVRCGCGCLAHVKLASLSEMLGVDGCFASCNYQQPCMTQNCNQYIDRCNRQ